MVLQEELLSRREPYPTAVVPTEGVPQWPPQEPPAAMFAEVGELVQANAPAVVGQNSADGEPRVEAKELPVPKSTRLA